MELISLTYKINKNYSLFSNLLKILKSDISKSSLKSMNQEHIALYIIQIEIFHLLQKYRVYDINSIFDNLFLEKNNETPLKTFLNIIEIINFAK